MGGEKKSSQSLGKDNRGEGEEKSIFLLRAFRSRKMRRGRRRMLTA